MLTLIPLTWSALIALIVAAFHVWEVRERRQQRAQQVVDRSGVSFIHIGTDKL